MDTQNDKGNDFFVYFVITQMICKDPWGRVVRYISFKLLQCSCMCYSETISSIDSIIKRTNERANRKASGGEEGGGISTRSLVRGEGGRASGEN